jgi:hypothetical protein
MYSNDGQVTIDFADSLELAAGSIYEQTGGVTTVNGSMRFAVTGGPMAQAMFSGGRLTGAGFIALPVQNTGATVEPGNSSVGNLRLTNSYTQGDGGTLMMEIGGTGSNQYDVLTVSGAATLGGTLDVRFVDAGSGMFSAAAGDRFTLLTTTFDIIDSFDNVLLPELDGDLEWHLQYSANAVALIAAMPGDFNFDNTLDAADYVALRKFEASAEDFNTWRTNFGRTAAAGGGGQSNVPEPTSATVVLLVLGLLGRCPRRR